MVKRAAESDASDSTISSSSSSLLFSSSSAGRERDTNPKKCRLHLTSPTFLAVTRLMSKLCNDFSSDVIGAIKEVVQPAQISATYSGGLNDEVYIDRAKMSLLPGQFSYRYSLGKDGSGFVSFDQQLPRCLTHICFGGEPSIECMSSEKSYTPSKIELHLLDRIANRLVNAWLTLWSGYFEIPETRSNLALWMGRNSTDCKLVGEEGCIEARFEVKFVEAAAETSSFSLPIQFFLPVLPLENAVFSADQAGPGGLLPEGPPALSSLLKTSVAISAKLMSFSLPVSRVQVLKVGDVVPVDQPETAGLYVEGVPIGHGVIARQSGFIALQVSDLSPDGGTYDGC